MLWLAGLPIATFFFAFLLIIKKKLIGFRLSFLWAVIGWALFTVALTEGLSFFHFLGRGIVAVFWIFAAAVILVLLIKEKQKVQISCRAGFSLLEKFFLFLTILVISCAGLNAFFAAPNNWDSMTYHLPRVLHWIQNQSVEHYPTHNLRQLYQPPGAGFFILQFHILAGTDRFANLAQWFAMLGSAVVLSQVAAELGAIRKGQIVAAFLSVTIPMGILQSTSTQNDYVAGFWMCAFVYFILRLLRQDQKISFKDPDLIGAGLTLGLGLLTKGSVYLFFVPWLLWFVIDGIFKKRKNLIGGLAVILTVSLVINAGFYTRNIKVFGAPLSVGSEEYTNSGNIIVNGISNVVRNIVLHFGTPSEEINNRLKQGVVAFHRFAGLGEMTEKNTWGEFDIPAWSPNEDVAGNPLHVFLILAGMVCVLLNRQTSRRLRFYIFAVCGAFVFFCVLLKWQLWHSRLQLPLFLLATPIAALFLVNIRRQVVFVGIVALLILSAIPPLIFNERRPLVGKKNVFNMPRVEQYFSYRRFMALPYFLSAKYAASRSPSEIGLLLGGDDWEYPLWVLLKKDNPDVCIRHIGVQNVSGKLLTGSGKDTPLIISELADPPDVLNLNEHAYVKRQQFAFMSIYEKPAP